MRDPDENSDIAPIFEPDVLLPVQYFSAITRRRPPKDGERRLLNAVIKDAVECFQNYLGSPAPRRRRLYREAEHWIVTRDVGQYSDDRLSFDGICELLGISPAYLRNGLLDWRDRELARRALARQRARGDSDGA